MSLKEFCPGFEAVLAHDVRFLRAGGESEGGRERRRGREREGEVTTNEEAGGGKGRRRRCVSADKMTMGM